jgi:DNA-binding transcriptional LysR family regulator
LGNLYAWEFVRNDRPLNVRVEGPLTFNSPDLCLKAAREGVGLAFVPEPYVTADLAEGRLVRALTEYCPVFTGFHLYYPSRRQMSPALALVVSQLRWRG